MARTSNRVSRPLSTLISSTLIGVAFTLFISSAVLAKQQLIDKIIVIVNDGIIVESALKQKMDALKGLLLATGKAIPDEKTLRKEALEQLILRTIQLQTAKNQGIKATSDHIDNMMNALAKQNNVDYQQLLVLIRQQQGNVLQFRQKIAEDFIIDQLKQNIINSRIQINEQDLKDEIQVIEQERNKNTKYHLKHYLINSNTLTIKDLKQQAKNIKQQLLLGQTAEQLTTNNIKVQSKDLGFRTPESLPNVFINAIQGLKVGQISDVVAIENGIHLLKVINKESATRIIIPEKKARHILLQITPLRNDRKTLEAITKLRQQLRAGASFAQLAKEFSDDTGSAINGGDLGWFGPGKMVKVFDQTLNKLQVNEISTPFKSQFGWHIVELQGTRKNDITEEKVKELAQKKLIDKKVSIETKRWLNRIKQEAYIEYR